MSHAHGLASRASYLRQRRTSKAPRSRLGPIITALAATLLAPAAMAAVELDLRLAATPAQPGEQVLVEITISNTGSDAERDLVLNVPFPAGLVDLSTAVVTGGTNTSNSCEQVNTSGSVCQPGETLIRTLDTIGPFSARVVTFPITIAADTPDGDAIALSAEITEFGDERASDAETLGVDADVALAVTVDGDKDPVAPGEVLTYRINYGNPDVTLLSDGTLTATLPPNTTLLEASGNPAVVGQQLTWDLGTLVAGAGGREIVQVQVDGGAPLGSLLQVDADLSGTADFETTVRSTSEAAYVSGATPLALSLGVNPAPAKPGEQVLLQLQLSNPTASPVIDPLVTLRLPPGVLDVTTAVTLGGVDVSDSCEQVNTSGSVCQANESFFWRLPVVNPGRSVQLSFPVTVAGGTAPGALVDWAARIGDASGAESWEDATLRVDANDLPAVTVDESADPAAPGEIYTYVINYGNTAPGSLSSPALTLTVPDAASVLDASGGALVDGDTVSWSFPTLAAGTVAQEIVRVRVADSATTGTLLPVEAAFSGTTNFQAVTRRAQEAGYVGVGDALDLSVNLDRAPARPGEQVLVSLDLTNATASPLFDGEVLIRYPQGLFDVATAVSLGDIDAPASCEQVNTSGSVCQANEFLIWRFDQLNPGRSTELSFPVTVIDTATAGDLIAWRARLTDAAGPPAWSNVTLPVDSALTAAVAIDEDADPAAPGGLLTYTLHYGNPAPTALADAGLTLELAPGTTFISASAGAIFQDGEVRWQFGELPSGFVSRETVRVLVNADQTAGSLLPVVATLDGEQDFQASVRRAGETTSVGDAAPLALELNVNPRPALPGEQVLVSLNLANVSNSPTVDGEVLVRYPRDMLDLPTSISLGALDLVTSCEQVNTSGSVCQPNEFLIWDYPSLAPGQSVELSFPATVNATTPVGSLIDWTSRIREAGGTESQEQRTLAVDGNALATLAIDESVDPVAPGARLTYTIRYGNAAAVGIEDATLEAVLPSDVVFLGATGDETLTGRTVSWSLGDLPVGAIGQRVVQVQVRGLAGEGLLLPVGASLTGTANGAATVERASEAAYVASDSPLALNLRVNPTPADAGTGTEVTVDLTNTGDSSVLDAEVIVRYPQGLIDLQTADVTGALDVAASCEQVNTSGSVCQANEFLIWRVPEVFAGETLRFTLPPVIDADTSRGTLIDWTARAREASGSEAWRVSNLPVSAALPDADSDGIADGFDNCSTVANPDQRDSNGDGFGNLCDGDFNGDNVVNIADFQIFRGVLFTDAPDQDLNGDGIVNIADFQIFRPQFGGPPGPSDVAP